MSLKRENWPIVVCGPARGGTSAVRTMLNFHPNIDVGREVPLGRLPSLRSLLEEIADRWAIGASGGEGGLSFARLVMVKGC